MTNNLPEMTGVHWHGIILPNPMDGVPGLEFPGIMPGETFTYRFPVVQSGTYWYHSHMGYQEQKGVYGALVIEPDGEPLIKVDRDYTIVLSDWLDGSPLIVQNNLKHQSDYYNFNRRTLGTFFSDVEQSGLIATVKERWNWADMRMDPSGLQQPTSIAFTYLMNGKRSDENWTGLFQPGERVRLRFINTSAQSAYDVSIPGLTMNVVHVHGNDVMPVPVDQFASTWPRLTTWSCSRGTTGLTPSSRKTSRAAAMPAARWRRGPACRPRCHRSMSRRCATWPTWA